MHGAGGELGPTPAVVRGHAATLDPSLGGDVQRLEVVGRAGKESVRTRAERRRESEPNHGARAAMVARTIRKKIVVMD